MILDRLRDLRARLSDDDVPPEGYKAQPVRWVLDLSADGRVVGLTPTEGGTKKGKPMQTPYARRSGQKPPPFLLVDKPVYVLGLDADGGPSEKAEARHAEYLALLDEAARETEDGRIALLADALRDTGGVEAARDQLLTEKWAVGDLIAPRLDGDFLHRAPAAKRFWSARQSGADDDGAFVAACLLCGEEKPVATKHPIEIRVGPNPAPLVSMNKAAFTSHGLRQSENAPMCYDCARSYGEALRYLLTDDAHHLYVGGAEWLFWTREPAPGWSIADLFADPTPEAVALLKAPFTGHAPDADPNRLYALVVTGAWKRLVVRSWLDRPLGEVQAHLADFFDRQRIVGRGGEAPPQKLMALAGATVRDLKDLPPQTVPALLEHALMGRRLPSSLLYQAVRRAALDRDQNGNPTPVTRARAALIRLVLSSTHPETMTDAVLTPDHPDPAYHCGRLLAVLDGIQSDAINTTLVDRFYGSASTTPAAVFGTLVKKAQPHLSKLRKTRTGLYHYFERQISEISMHIEGFPTTLSPEQQGLFALGFYQQKNRPKTTAPPDSDSDAGADA